MEIMIKTYLKKMKFVKQLYYLLKPTSEFIRFKFFDLIISYMDFLRDYQYFRRNVYLNKNIGNIRFYPCLFDKTPITPIEPIYFFQDMWAASKIFDLKPKKIVDVGSSVKFLSIIAQFIPVIFVDIRPLKISVPNLTMITGSILDLPFEDSSVEFLTSLCVIEHVGLGRYGDPIDPLGSEKSFREISRVLMKGGFFMFSVPVENGNTIYFNAHRAFSRTYILEILEKNQLQLIEEKYIYGFKLENGYNPDDSGVGLFLTKKF